MSCATGAWVLYEWFFISFVGFAEGVFRPLEPHPSHTGAHWQGAFEHFFDIFFHASSDMASTPYSARVPQAGTVWNAYG
jgi:hypothetical protein